MNAADLFAIVVLGTALGVGFLLGLYRWSKTLLVLCVLAGCILAAALLGMVRSQDWGAMLFLAVALFLAAPMLLGLGAGAVAAVVYRRVRTR